MASKIFLRRSRTVGGATISGVLLSSISVNLSVKSFKKRITPSCSFLDFSEYAFTVTSIKSSNRSEMSVWGPGPGSNPIDLTHIGRFKSTGKCLYRIVTRASSFHVAYPAPIMKPGQDALTAQSSTKNESIKENISLSLSLEDIFILSSKL